MEFVCFVHNPALLPYTAHGEVRTVIERFVRPSNQEYWPAERLSLALSFMLISHQFSVERRYNELNAEEAYGR